MQVVVCASQKGGSGKTTLAGHLAVMADAAGYGPVAMLDTDPQGSLAQWWNARRADSPYFVRSSLTELPETLAALDERGINLVVIDTPPAITIAIRSVVENADLVIVPVRPSPHDLRAAGATVDLVEGLDRPFVFVLNGASARARITADAAVALSQHGTVAPVTVHNRTEFAVSMSDGRTVMEYNPEGRSAQEMTSLWGYVADRLDRAARLSGRLAPRPTAHVLSDFVRETYDPAPRAASLVARDGAPRATAGADPVLSARSPSPQMSGFAPAAPAPDTHMPPMRVVEADPWDDGIDEDEDAEDDGAAAAFAEAPVRKTEQPRPAPVLRMAPERSYRPATPTGRRTVTPTSAPPPPLTASAGPAVPPQRRPTLLQRFVFGRRGMAEV